MSMFNFPGASTPTSLIAPVSAANTAAATSAAFDTRDYEGSFAVIENHGAGTGTLDGVIQDSDDGSTGWANVAGASFTQKTTGASVQCVALPKQTKRFIRYVGTIGTGPHLLSVSICGVKKSV